MWQLNLTEFGVGPMRIRALTFVGAAFAALATSAVAGGWDHTFSRGFDLYLIGSDQSGIRLVCDSDALIRKGSYIEVRSSVAGGKVPSNARFVIGAFSHPVSVGADLSVVFKRLSPKDHADLAAAFATAKTAQIISGETVIAEADLGAERPKICE